MGDLRTKLACFVALALFLLAPGAARAYSVKEVRSAILHLAPKLTFARASTYARAILKAHQKYSIDPSTLIAIAHQESSFREALPEGAAGERGICQIRKIWLENPQFLQEFGTRSVKSLEDPAQAFQFAAWILDDLKKKVALGTLPYWSYYNARRFEPRLRYFVAVNKKLVKLRRYGLGRPAVATANVATNTSASRNIAGEARTALRKTQTGQLSGAYNSPVATKLSRSLSMSNRASD